MKAVRPGKWPAPAAFPVPSLLTDKNLQTASGEAAGLLGGPQGGPRVR